jgi:hypothetical protein
MASSNVSPAEKQPGKSGTATPHALVCVPGSIAMMNFIVSPFNVVRRPWKYVEHTVSEAIFFECQF